MKLPETSWLHVLWRKCRTCSCSLFFFIVAHFHPASISHFLTAATVVSAPQDAGGHTLSHQNNLTFGIGLQEVGVRTVGVRTLRHNQIFLLS